MCSTVNLRLKGLKAQRFKGSSSLMFTWYIYLEAEPYERNVEEVACSPSIGFSRNCSMIISLRGDI